MPVLQALFMLPVQEEGGTERANCPPISISPPCSVKEPQVFIWLHGDTEIRKVDLNPAFLAHPPPLWFVKFEPVANI